MSRKNRTYKTIDNGGTAFFVEVAKKVSVSKNMDTEDYINGEWIGVTRKPFDLVEILKTKRRQGIINRMASINFNIKIWKHHYLACWYFGKFALCMQCGKHNTPIREISSC